MATVKKSEPEFVALHKKLDTVIAVLFRLLNDDGLEKWNKQDKPNMVKALIKLGFANDEISRILGLAYGSVANIRTEHKKKTKKKGK